MPALLPMVSWASASTVASHQCRRDTSVGVIENLACRPVVVLAERDKDDMDKQLKKALRGQKLEWHTRSGAPHAIADLEKVAAGQARTIIVLQPDEEEVRPSPL